MERLPAAVSGFPEGGCSVGEKRHNSWRGWIDWLWLLAACVLSSLVIVHGITGGEIGATFDEPFYVQAGLTAWRSGSNKLLMRAGTMTLAVDVQTLPLYLWETWRGVPWELSHDWPQMLRVARMANLLFWWLLLFMVWRLGWQWGGPWGGRGAVAFVACEPNLLAHAGLATTDIALAACLLLFLDSFWRGRDQPWSRRVLLPGVFYGVALTAKASALVFGLQGMIVLGLWHLWQSGNKVQRAPSEGGNWQFAGRMLRFLWQRSVTLRWDIVAIVLVGLAVAYALHRDAIPLLPVDLQVGPNEAAARARDFLREQGFDPAGFEVVTTFFVRRDELDYLHRLGGGAAVERARQQGVVLWYWQVRFFRPGDIRGFEVWVGTDGRPVGFGYRAPEDEAGGRLAPEDAVRLTRAVLGRVAAGWADDWQLVEVIQQARPRRFDYQITWEQPTPLLGEARRRVAFAVQGDRLAGIQPYVKVPESWQRLRAGENQRGATLASLGWTGAYLIAFAALVLVLARLGREPLPWGFAAAVAGGFLLISGVAALNALPLAWAGYDPATSPVAFLVGQAQNWAGVFGLEAAAAFAATLAGPPLVVALVIGVVVSLFQAMTQVNEMALSFIPKLVAVIAVLGVLGPWMLQTAVTYTTAGIEGLPNLVH